jgi:uncharacterized protein
MPAATYALHSGNRKVAGRVQLARNPLARLRGLLGKPGLSVDEAIYIEPCSSIHTFFMRFPIDVIFVSRAGEIVKTVESVPPWHVVLGGKGAHAVFELPAGTLSALKIEPGALVDLAPAA